MNVRIAAPLLGLSLSLLASSATAQVQANLRPDRVGAPYRFVLELVSDGGPVDVVFDRRLLTLRVHAQGRRRPLTCRHPAAPSRVLSSRVVHLDSSSSRVAEWLDLRMYCTGRALAALRAGASVEARYGFRRRGRRRWVVKPEEGPRVSRLELAEFSIPPVASPVPADGPIRLTLRSSTLHVGSPPSLSVTLRSSGPTQRVYPRDDLYSLHIRGPLGELDCSQSRLPISPIVDLYRRISTRRGVSARIGTAHACPEAFSVPGVYEVTPTVDLVYGGERYGLEALTGRFQGTPGLLRVVGHGYVAHPLDDGAP